MTPEAHFSTLAARRSELGKNPQIVLEGPETSTNLRCAGNEAN